MTVYGDENSVSRRCFATILTAGCTGLLIAPLLARQSSAAEQLAGLPETGERKLTILRGGDPIGSHHIRFRRMGEKIAFEVDAKAEVKLLGITVFRFSHKGSESWQAGHLESLATTTDDDGERHQVTLRRSADGQLEVTSEGAVTQVAGDSVPSSLWHRDLLLQRPRDELLHTIHGGLLPMTVTDLGSREMELRGQSITVQGYEVDAKPDFYRVLWYDEEGLLVAARLSGDDGSAVTLKWE